MHHTRALILTRMRTELDKMTITSQQLATFRDMYLASNLRQSEQRGLYYTLALRLIVHYMVFAQGRVRSEIYPVPGHAM